MNKVIKIAIQEANKSKYIYRLGAITLKGNQVIAKGYNKLSNHPFLKRKYGYYSIHAEANVILKSGKNNATTLVVVRILKDRSLICSFPCKKCQKMAKDFGIKKIIYIDWDGKPQEIKL